MKKTLEDVVLKDKKVLVRVDFNVPLKNRKITDDTRIRAAVKTISYIVAQGGKVILFSHLGRIETKEDKREYSLEPVADRLSDIMGKTVLFSDKTRGKDLENAIDEMQN